MATSILAGLVLMYAAYEHYAPGAPKDDEISTVACAACAEHQGPASKAGAAPDAPGPLHGIGALRDRVFAAIRHVLAGLDAPSQPDHHANSATGRDFDAQCAEGRGSSAGQCSSYGLGRHAGTRSVSSAGRAPGPRAPISGRVMDAAGLGIPGVTVTVAATRLYDGDAAGSGPGTPGRPVTSTDSSGVYEFPGLPEGDYEVRTAAHGSYGPARIAARSGVRNADIVLIAPDTRVIEGRVLGASGEALESVAVLPVLVGVPSVRTDAQGAYRLPVPLKPGTASLNVRFQLPGFLDHYASVDLSRRTGLSNAPLNVTMRPVEYWTNVAGVVTSANGPPLAARSVELRQVGGRRSYRTTTDRRGRYAFDAVEAPLAYYLSVSGGPDHRDHRERIEVTPQAAERDVVIEPYDFGSVRGRLVNADGAPISNFNLVLRNAASSSPSAIVSSDEFGNFNIPMAPAGELTVASQSSPSILVQGLHLEAGAEIDLPLVLDWGEHELRGIVVDGNNNPVPAARVLLTWSHRAGEVTTMTTRRARSDSQGIFYFSDLGPGPHVLQIDPPGHRRLQIAHDVTLEGYSVTVHL